MKRLPSALVIAFFANVALMRAEFLQMDLSIFGMD